MIRTEIVDVRFVTRVLFLCLTALNFGNTFGHLWLGILFALYFLAVGCLNATRRREFSKRPPYRKLPAYLAIVPLALYWVMTPGIQNGINPVLVFLPGLYLLFLAALQERSRGNGGFDTFVMFNSMAVLLCSTYMAPRGSFPVVVTGLFLLIFSNSRRGTSLYKYALFLALFAGLGGISYGGWQYWKSQRQYGSWNRDYANANQMMGFDPAVSLGSFGQSYNSKQNNQVVLRIWDDDPPEYLVASRYINYAGGTWKLPKNHVKTLTPAYYQVDYPVMEIVDSVTRKNARRVWVQSTLDNFGYLFAPTSAVGFSVKDIDSLHYFSGGMVSGMNQNGTRSDWYYFVSLDKDFEKPRELSEPDSLDLQMLSLYEGLTDSVIQAMDLQSAEIQAISEGAGYAVLNQMMKYFNENFQYSLQVPELEKRNIQGARVDPLHVFWKNRRGYCEYFASLSVLTLRRLGYPARYISGFAHPEIKSSYAVFRRKHAHAWVEVYIEGNWVRFDPTPVVMNFNLESPSWFKDFGEKFQAHWARWTHKLKEGSWRSLLDGWQNSLENVSESPITYGVLMFLLFALFFYRFVVIRRRNRLKVSASSVMAKEWARKLTRAEYRLSRAELFREDGETVGRFLERIEKQPLSGKAASARETLREYEAHRWKI